MENRGFEVLTGSVICNQLALHYNEQLKHTRYYKYNVKRFGNLYNRELITAEKKEFDKIFDADETDTTHLLSANIQDFINEVTKVGFIEFAMFQQLLKAYVIDKKSIEGIVLKVLKNYDL